MRCASYSGNEAVQEIAWLSCGRQGLPAARRCNANAQRASANVTAAEAQSVAIDLVVIVASRIDGIATTSQPAHNHGGSTPLRLRQCGWSPTQQHSTHHVAHDGKTMLVLHVRGFATRARN